MDVNRQLDGASLYIGPFLTIGENILWWSCGTPMMTLRQKQTKVDPDGKGMVDKPSSRVLGEEGRQRAYTGVHVLGKELPSL